MNLRVSGFRRSLTLRQHRGTFQHTDNSANQSLHFRQCVWRNGFLEPLPALIFSLRKVLRHTGWEIWIAKVSALNLTASLFEHMQFLNRLLCAACALHLAFASPPGLPSSLYGHLVSESDFELNLQPPEVLLFCIRNLMYVFPLGCRKRLKIRKKGSTHS